jgi:transcriptional regulator with XRE-family HTH domain
MRGKFTTTSAALKTLACSRDRLSGAEGMPKSGRTAEDVASLKGMGLAIVELRESRELNKTELAAKAGIATSTLLDIELGKTEAKWGTLRRLATALTIPLDALIEMADELAPGIGRAAKRKRASSPGAGAQ